MKITFPDQSQKEFNCGVTAFEIATSISEGLARNACGAIVNGTLTDLTAPLNHDATISILTTKDVAGLEIFRHTSSHIMALAVKRLYPSVKIAIGPAIEDGFYYDFDKLELKFENLPAIEEEMKKIVEEDLPITCREASKEEALNFFIDEPYKIELIQSLPADAKITLYTVGEFTDLCRGPHLPRTGMVKAFKLLRLAGAYWRGKSENPMLTRIYATSFPDKKLLKDYLTMLEEALKRDHNKLGRELDLFITDPTIGQGLPLLTPKGAAIKSALIRFVEEEEMKRGYSKTITPFMAKSDLYKVSGHWDHYRDGMFIIEEGGGDVMALRPMTCPYHFTIFNSKKRSYRELPIRYSETSNLFRNESSGEMHGLIRVRQFTISEGHIVCQPEQVAEEFKNAFELARYMLDTLGFEGDYWFRFSKWDPNNLEKYINNPDGWERTQSQMKTILDSMGVEYEEADGEAAFYGPKLDIQMKNVYGKADTMITIQIDFALPGRFQMKYINQNNEEVEPIIIHRTSIGCYERTMAYLIEKLAGKFPFWLAPEQIAILTVSDKVHDYAQELLTIFREEGLRSFIDERSESLNKKVRDAQLSYIPCILTIGEKEKENRTISIRTLEGKVQFGITIDDFIATCYKMNRTKSKTNLFN